jgi:hypothetical protein
LTKTFQIGLGQARELFDDRFNLSEKNRLTKDPLFLLAQEDPMGDDG